MNGAHIISTTVPVKGFDITALKFRPCAVEDKAAGKVHFGHNATCLTRLDIPVQRP